MDAKSFWYKVSDRIIVIKILFQSIIVSVISVYVLECYLDDSATGHFYDIFIVFTSICWLKKVVIIKVYYSGHTGDFTEYRGYGFGVSNKEGERFLGFCAFTGLAMVGGSLAIVWP